MHMPNDSDDIFNDVFDTDDNKGAKWFLITLTGISLIFYFFFVQGKLGMDPIFWVAIVPILIACVVMVIKGHYILCILLGNIASVAACCVYCFLTNQLVNIVQNILLIVLCVCLFFSPVPFAIAYGLGRGLED